MTIEKLLTIDELDRNTDQLVGLDNVEITPLGKSRLGRDIRLISVGEGDRDALILGVPHPNEPVGALTVEQLIKHVLTDTRTQNMGFRWHFVKAIDPDGLKMNEGWLTEPLTLRNYMRHYFRPALKNQPEYSFPLEHKSYTFNKPTPENLCWQRALEITRPVFQSSLHHADCGGVFHCVSRDIPALSTSLSQLAQESCFGVNPLGDPAMSEAPFTMGVFGYPNLTKVLDASGGKGWPAGNTASSWAEQRYNTFSLVTEVPLWHDERVLDSSPSGVTVGDVVDDQLTAFMGVIQALDSALPLLSRKVDRIEGLEILAALEETRQFASGFREEIDAAMGAEDFTIELPKNVCVARSQLTLVAMRSHALIIRLCNQMETGGDDEIDSIRATSESSLEALIQKFETDANLEPASLTALTKIQMDAILTTAKYFSEN